MNNPIVKSYIPQAIKAVEDGTKKAQIETAIKVTSQAKSLAPVATGQLRGSIMWKTKSSSGGRTEGPELETDPKSDLSVVVGTSVEHAVYQEFGTRKMAAKPFLRPAVAIVTEKSGYEKAVADAMEKTVQENMRVVK